MPDHDPTLMHLTAATHEGAAEQAPRVALLTVIRGGDADLGKHVPVDRVVLLGRNPACALPLHDRGVSWEHARVKPLGGERYLLEDLASTNGIQINGERVVDSHLLRAGEKVQIGSALVRFSLADAAELQFYREMESRVAQDPLTGLDSKRRFDDMLDSALEQARHTRAPLAVLMMDMDGIKRVNDQHGHVFGAYCIKTAGEIIGREIGTAGRACRYGGDEFTAFLVQHDRQAARAVAERIRDAIEKAGMEKDGIALAPTLSLGVAVYTDNGEEVLDLIVAADQALYRAKAEGRNRVCD